MMAKASLSKIPDCLIAYTSPWLPSIITMVRSTTRWGWFTLFKWVRDAKKEDWKPDTLYFLGFTHYSTVYRKGFFKIGRRTERSWLRRSINQLYKMMWKIMHYKVTDQIKKINQVLRGHYNYYDMGGNFISMFKNLFKC